MTRLKAIIVVLAACLLAGGSLAQQKQSTSKPKTANKKKPAPASDSKPATPPTAAPAPSAADQLEPVLDAMDKSAAEFHSAEADFTWDQFNAVVQETDTQTGRVYFVRHEKDTHMAADIQAPDKKYVLYTDAKIRMYQPKIDQITEYDAGKNKAEVESFLVLGFGGRGHDLPKSFAVTFAGFETIDGIKTAKLELIPKTERVKNMFARILLWVDTARDVSLKQQAFEPSGDYRTATYKNIKMNDKIPDDVFKLKTTPKTKVVKQS